MGQPIMDAAMAACTPHERKVLGWFRAGATAWRSLSERDKRSCHLVGVPEQERVSDALIVRLVELDAIKCGYAGDDVEYRATLPEELRSLSDRARAYLVSCRKQNGVLAGGSDDDRRVSVPLYRKGLLRMEVSSSGMIWWKVAW